MKIALVVPGGVDRSAEHRVIPALLSLIRRLADDHEVHVFALAQEKIAGSWTLEGAQVHNIGGEGSLRRAVRAVRAVLREHRAAPFAVVQSIWSGSCAMTAVSAARIARVPCLVHVAGGELVDMPQIGYGGRRTLAGKLRESLVLRAADAVSAASASVVEQIAARGRGAHRIPLGVDLGRWPPRAPVRRDAGAPVRLIHVASLNRVKDQTTLLRSLAALAAMGVEFSMDVIGEDRLGGEIQSLARDWGLCPRVVFHGFLTQRQLRPLFERAHVNVVSSRHEAGPLVVLEAAVLGVPTAGTCVGHIAEWAPEAALAVPVASPDALAAAIRSLAEDEDLRLSIAARAQLVAIQQDADFTAARFGELHASLLRR